MNFYPRSPCGERRPTKTCGCRMTIFLSTLSLRRATADRLQPEHDSLISIHALLAESDGNPYAGAGDPVISIHALLAESDAQPQASFSLAFQFLSTLSLRRATAWTMWLPVLQKHFYPRSPCGERPYGLFLFGGRNNFYPRSPCGERQLISMLNRPHSQISIHALLAESDRFASC